MVRLLEMLVAVVEMVVVGVALAMRGAPVAMEGHCLLMPPRLWRCLYFVVVSPWNPPLLLLLSLY